MSQPEKAAAKKISADSRHLRLRGLIVRTRMKRFAIKLTSASLAKLAFAITAAWPSAGQADGTGLAKRAMHLLRDNCIRCHNAKKKQGRP